MIRTVAFATAVLVAVIVTPYALAPAFNGADLVQWAALLTVLALVTRAARTPRPVSRHFETPAGGVDSSPECAPTAAPPAAPPTT